MHLSTEMSVRPWGWGQSQSLTKDAVTHVPLLWPAATTVSTILVCHVTVALWLGPYEICFPLFPFLFTGFCVLFLVLPHKGMRLQVLNQHYADRIRKTAYNQVHRGCSQAALSSTSLERPCILGVSDKFHRFFPFFFFFLLSILPASQEAASTCWHCLRGGWECLWSDARAVPCISEPQEISSLDKHLSFSQKSEFQLRDILCLTTDSAFTGQLCDSSRDSIILLKIPKWQTLLRCN